MPRVIPSLIALAAASLLAAPALGADWDEGGDFRGPYAADPELQSGDALDFDIGVRYWYALGSQSMTFGGDGYTLTDQSHIIEAHARIEDDATSSYVSALAGYAGRIDGTYSNPTVTDGKILGGTIGYAQGDFGWMPLGDTNFRVGGLVGYQYWNDSPDVGRANFTTPTGVDSEVNSFNINSLRLGVTSKFDFDGMFDLTAELAAVPFGWATGTFGAYGTGNIVIGADTYTQASAATVEGRLWGGQAQMLLGLHPTENITVRLGGRAWYLTGPVEGVVSLVNIADDTDTVNVIGEFEDFSLFRYGAIAELSYSF